MIYAQVLVDGLIVETLRDQYANTGQVFDDLDRLAGTWSTNEAADFAEAVAPLAEIDPRLWATEPKSAYRVKPELRRKTRK